MKKIQTSRAHAAVALMAAGSLVFGGILGSSTLTAAPAYAEANDFVGHKNMLGTGNNTFYIYAKKGEKVYGWVKWSSTPTTAPDDATSTVSMISPSGKVLAEEKVSEANPEFKRQEFTADEDGLYAFQLKNSPYSINYEWSAGNTKGPGYVMAKRYGAYQTEGAADDSAVADLKYYHIKDDGHMYETVQKDYHGIYSDFSFNSVGYNIDGKPFYESLTWAAPDGSLGADEFNKIEHDYKKEGFSSGFDKPGALWTFFAEPAKDLPAMAKSFDRDEPRFVKPALIDRSKLITDLKFTPTTTNSAAGTITLKKSDRFVQPYDLKITAKGYKDRLVELKSTDGNDVKVNWDGKDGDGKLIAENTPITIEAKVDYYGEMHIVRQDVERAGGGIQVKDITPGSKTEGNFLDLSWDDSGLHKGWEAGTAIKGGHPVKNLKGINSKGGVHGWDNMAEDKDGYLSWGDQSFIDDWTYVDKNVSLFGPTEYTKTTLSAKAELEKKAEIADANGNGTLDVGEEITYSFTAKNSGESALTDFSIVDPMFTDSEITPAKQDLPVGGSVEFTAKKTLSQADFDKLVADGTQELKNTAYGQGTDISKVTRKTNTSTADVGLSAPDPNLVVEKKADLVDENEDGKVNAGEKVNYSFVVKNTGNVTMKDVTINDDRLPDYKPEGVELAPGAEHVFEGAEYTATQDDVDTALKDGVEGLKNVARATGEDPTGKSFTSEDAENLVPMDMIDKLEIEKQAELKDENGNKSADKGEKILYTFKVKNTGSTTVHKVTIKDAMLGEFEQEDLTLAPGEEAEIKAPEYIFDSEALKDGGEEASGHVDKDGRLINIATAEGENAAGGKVESDEGKAEVPVTPEEEPAEDKPEEATPADPEDIGDKPLPDKPAVQSGGVVAAGIAGLVAAVLAAGMGAFAMLARMGEKVRREGSDS